VRITSGGAELAARQFNLTWTVQSYAPVTTTDIAAKETVSTLPVPHY
jgi:hypothetical protein